MRIPASPRNRPIRGNTRLLAALCAAFVCFFAGWPYAAPLAHAADGSGAAVVTPSSVNAGSLGNTLTFTFTAAETMDSGSVRINVPSGWSAPQGTSGVAGYVTASTAGGIIANVEDTLDSAANWAAQAGNCNLGLSADASVLHEGAASLSCKNSSAANNLVFYRNLAATEDWSGYTNVGFWIRTSANLNASQLRFQYSTATNLSTTIASLNLPAITANTWTYVNLPLSGVRTSVVSFGFQTAGATAQTNNINIDDILLGPGLPSFPGGGDIRVRLLQLAGGQTVTVTYGAGGGASGASAPASGTSSIFSTTTRISDAGTLTGIASSPIVTVFNPAPTTTGISPSSRVAGSGSFTLTVNGTNFVPGSIVRMNGSDTVTTYVSPTQLTASILAGNLISPGSNAITVFNPTPGGGTSNAQTLTVAADSTAPSSVANLALSSPTTSSMVLTWTAPGDDGAVGTASLYDIRYSTAPIVTAADFTAAAQVSGEPVPSVAGTVQTMTVTGLSANTLYYFAMKTQDEVPNVSAMSNVPSLATASNPDSTPPATVTTLALSSPTTSSMVLTWTAPGDDGAVGTASLYDIRYSTAPIVTEADFTAASLVSGEPAPSIAGTVQTMTVTGLSANTLYYFAMKTQDEVPNVSAMSNVPSLSTAANPDVTPPAAVTTLALSGATTSSMVLTWTAPGDDGMVGTASLYDIRYSTAPIVTAADFTAAAPVSGEPAPSIAGTVQTMTVTGLSANTLYYFAMKTQDEVPNVSAMSNVPSLSTAANPDVTPPAAVTTLALSSPTTSSMVLTWTAPGDDGMVGTASLYEIVYATAPIVTEADFTAAADVIGEPAPAVAGTVQTMTVTGLSANTTYYFAMKTRDEVPNVSFMSNVPSLSTAANPDVTPPVAVTDLALSGATTSSLTLFWTAPGDDGSVGTAALYDIRYSTAPIATAADFSTASLVSGEPIPPAVAGTVQNMTVTGLSANTTYYFAMKTQDEVPNVSAMSNVPSLSTAANPDVTPPAPITTLALSGATTSSIILTWTAPGDDGSVGTASLYDIRYSTAPIVTAADFTAAALVSGEPIPAPAGTVQTRTVTGLSANTNYYFAMKTLDEVPNVSAVSNVVSLSTAATPDTVAPAAITNLSLQGTSTSELAVIWAAPGDDGNVGVAASYDIRYSTSPIVTEADFTAASQVSGEPPPASPGSFQGLVVSGLSANTTYFFAMKTQDEVPNISPISNVASRATAAAADVTPPSAVTDLTLSGAGLVSILLNWTAPGDDGNVGTAASYDIRYSTAHIVTDADFTTATPVSGEPAPLVAGTPQSMNVGGLSSGTTYFFAMKAQDEAPNIGAISNIPSLSTMSSGSGGGVADITPPSAVTDLALSGATASSMVLTWTAPGDDNNSGYASLYDIRYWTSPIVTPADFSAASLVSSEPYPAVAGTTQSMTVGNLAAGKTYYFAMKTRDESFNESGVSNVPSLATIAVSGGGGGGGGGGVPADTTPPVVSAVSAASITKTSVIITWKTDENADSLVRFGPTIALGGTASDGTLVTAHAVPITGLTAGTTYHYTACSKDFSGNQRCLGDLNFTTLPVNAPVPTYGAAEALAASPTISVDKSLAAPSGTAHACVSGALIKQPSDGNPATQADSAVYYCGADGKRYAFPDAGTYRSWYPDFSGVTVVSVAALAAVPFGGNVTYRPGARMVKIQTDPKVYAVAKGGVLRWVTTEAVARALYGQLWNGLISDISDAFFVNYSVGAPISLADVAPIAPVAPPAPPAPAACTTTTTFTAFLSNGSSDAQVLPLQKLLQCLGYFPANVAPNGYFGPATESAVKAFQAANGIDAFGYVGPATRDALNRYTIK